MSSGRGGFFAPAATMLYGDVEKSSNLNSLRAIDIEHEPAVQRHLPCAQTNWFVFAIA